jgi:hypothetical protein
MCVSFVMNHERDFSSTCRKEQLTNMLKLNAKATIINSQDASVPISPHWVAITMDI